MSKQRLTESELRDHLHEHVAWLDSSIRAYDAGNEHESKRLAHTIRQLLHDTRNSHSLLGQLGIKDSLRYWSVHPDFGDAPVAVYQGLSLVFVTESGRTSFRYAPILSPPMQRLDFATWWEKERVLVDSETVVTRSRAILWLANKDGGSHVDPALTELERRFLRADLMGWQSVTIEGAHETVIYEERVGDSELAFRVTQFDGGKRIEEPSGLSSPLRALVRQIAHEIRATLKEQIAWLSD